MTGILGDAEKRLEASHESTCVRIALANPSFPLALALCRSRCTVRAMLAVAISDPSLPTTLEEGVRNRSWKMAQKERALGEGPVDHDSYFGLKYVPRWTR